MAHVVVNGGEEEREIQKNYWVEHSVGLTVEAMPLDSMASDLDKEERPEMTTAILKIDFIKDISEQFNHSNNLKLIARAHELVMQGFKWVHGGDVFSVSKSTGEIEGTHDDLLNEAQLAAIAEEKEAHSFEIDPSQVESVKQRCLPNGLNYPMLE